MTPLAFAALATLGMTACDGPSANRTTWLQGTLIEDNRTMLERSPSALTAGKFAKMSSRFYYYFRGSFSVFLGDSTRPGPGHVKTAFTSAAASEVLLLADPHPENLGSFRAPDGAMTVDYNDFDGTSYGPFHLDVRRLGLGFAVAMSEMQRSPEESAAVVEAAVRGYVDEIAALDRGEEPIDVRRSAGFGAIVDDVMRRGQRDGDSREALDEYTVVEDGARAMFFGDVEPPTNGRPTDRVVEVSDAEDALVRTLVARSRETLAEPVADGFLAVKGVSRRLGAGVSSYPLRRYYALVEGETPAIEDDRLLELKELPDPPSPARPFAVNNRDFANNGQRVVFGQRTLQLSPLNDPLLGWATAGPMSVRIRERSKYQKGIDVERIADRLSDNRWTIDDVIDYARVTGRLLARAHSKAPTRSGKAGLSVIAPLITADPEGFVGETTRFVTGYVDVVVEDYARFNTLITEEGPWLGYRFSASRP